MAEIKLYELPDGKATLVLNSGVATIVYTDSTGVEGSVSVLNFDPSQSFFAQEKQLEATVNQFIKSHKPPTTGAEFDDYIASHLEIKADGSLGEKQ